MVEGQHCAAERIIEDLESSGWKMGCSGISCINGTVGANLLKDGEVIMVQQDLRPDEEFLEEEWGGEDSDNGLP